MLAHVRPRIAVAFGELVPVMRGALSAARLPISVLVHDVAAETTPCTPLARVLASNDLDSFAEPELQPADLAAVLLSSGDDGLPKGVRLTHGYLTAAARQAGTPFLHSLGMIGSLCARLHAGAQIVASPTWDAERTLELAAAAEELA